MSRVVAGFVMVMLHSIPDVVAQQRILFPRGGSSATISGLVGDLSETYVLGAKAGQIMNLTFVPSHQSVYYKVTPPEQDSAMFIGNGTEGKNWSGILPRDGDYRIEVYFLRAEAQPRGASATYTLMASITEGVGGPVATPIRYLCADGSSATATYDNAVQPKVTIVAGSAMYHLNSVPSASGAKYSDGKVSWWTRGSEAYFELNGVSTICRR